MTGRRRLCWLGLSLVALTAAAAEPPLVYSEQFGVVRHEWNLDGQWRLTDGRLVADGLPEQLLVVGQEQPTLTDFRLKLVAERVEGTPSGGYGLIYRFNPAVGDGYFVWISGDQAYRFGQILKGEFKVTKEGQSTLLKPAPGKHLELEVEGRLHALRYGGELVTAWANNDFARGGFGLLVVGEVKVAFESIEVWSLDSAEAPVAAPVARPVFGPLPPGSPTTTPEPTPAPSPAAVLAPTRDRPPGEIGSEEIDLAQRWRGHWNRMAVAREEPPLPEELDAVDLAVLTFIDVRLGGQVAPTGGLLADWLRSEALAAAGAVGPAPEAALRFWVQYAAGPEPGGREAAQESLLAALTWWFAVRAKVTAGWAERGTYPLVVTNELRVKLNEDRRRYELAQPTEAAREQDRARLDRLFVQLCRRLGLEPTRVEP